MNMYSDRLAKLKWNARIFRLVAEKTHEESPASCTFDNQELARHTIEEAAFAFLEPEAVDWGFIDDPGTWEATLRDGRTVRHEILITMRGEQHAERFTADVLIDGVAYKAAAA
jgi:hypothetical protein